MLRHRLAALDRHVLDFLEGDGGAERHSRPIKPSTWVSPWASITAFLGAVVFVLQFTNWYDLTLHFIPGHDKHTGFPPALSGGWWTVAAAVTAFPTAYWLLCVSFIPIGRLRFGLVHRARMFIAVLCALITVVVEILRPPSIGDPDFSVTISWPGWISLVAAIAALTAVIFGPAAWRTPGNR